MADGTLLVLDGEAGTVTVSRRPPWCGRPRTGARAGEREEAEARARASLPAVTRDGVTVHVAANVAAPGELGAALAAGADGVGLLRTEFLFLGADHLPGEDEQERVYRTMAEGLGGRPLVVRTLDAGADKPLAWLPLGPEQNPFLGLRGIRLSLRHPALLAGQLRRRAARERRSPGAAAAADGDHRGRGPRGRATSLAEARESLAASGVAVPEHVELGIMVEVPAAALIVEAFVPHVDFFSLGTNDLAQYVLAADRGNGDVAALADALHPAVLRLIERVVRTAAAGGRPVSVCGEVAGDPLAIPLLLGLGSHRALDGSGAHTPGQAGRARRRSGRPGGSPREALAAESAAAVRRLVGRAG